MRTLIQEAALRQQHRNEHMGSFFAVTRSIVAGHQRAKFPLLVMQLLLPSAWLLAQQPDIVRFELGEPKPAVIDNKEARAASERTIAAALDWLARHQDADGSWSIMHNTKKCTDQTCTGGGSAKASVGATGLALLPFLAAGKSHTAKGEHQATILRGLQYLVRIEKPNGALSASSGHEMYEHGIATMALCDAYRVSKDPKLKVPAQLAVDYLQKAQNQLGGWRYKPRAMDTDTSVVSWQVKALHSAQLAGLKVDPQVMALAMTDLKRAGSGVKGGKFGYMPGRPATPAMTGAGLHCMQLLGIKADDPLIVEGFSYLMLNQPDIRKRNIYYWLGATQAMQEADVPTRETWNTNMQPILVTQQVTAGCAKGSWHPEGDPWGDNGGRLMLTTLSCLALQHIENSYKAKEKDQAKPAVAAPEKKPPAAKENPPPEVQKSVPKPEPAPSPFNEPPEANRTLFTKLAEVRTAAGSRQFEEANRLLKEAGDMAKRPADVELHRGMYLIVIYNEKFWQTVKSSLESAEGKLMLGATEATIVSSNAKEIQLQTPGKEYRFTYAELPPSVAVALAQRVLDKKPANQEVLAAYHYVAPRSSLEVARKHLQEASAGGTDTKLLQQLFDERELLGK
jgi:hypothetical protein